MNQKIHGILVSSDYQFHILTDAKLIWWELDFQEEAEEWKILSCKSFPVQNDYCSVSRSINGTQKNLVETESYKVEDDIQTEIKVWDMLNKTVKHKLQLPGRVDMMSDAYHEEARDAEEGDEADQPEAEEFMMIAVWDY